MTVWKEAGGSRSYELFVSGLGSRGRDGFEDAACTASVLQLTLSSPSARYPALETETHICVSSCLLGPPSYLVMREIMLPFNIRGDFKDLMKSHQPPPHPALFFFFFWSSSGLIIQHVVSFFPDQRSNPHLVHRKHRISTTGLPRPSWNPINLIQGSDVSPQAQLKEVNLNKIHVVQSPLHITASFLML